MISAPEDYGMTPAETLSHQCVSAPPENFESFWSSFREEIDCLSRRVSWPEQPGQYEVEVRSIRDVRVVARVFVPGTEPIGAVITTHGYEAPGVFTSDPLPWHELPLVTLELRVRGYPPSVRDTGDLRPGWISHHVEDPYAWVLRGAIADVIQAARGVRVYLPREAVLTMHGESLGGGLATIAAAQLSHMGEPIDRLVIGLPTFGDWQWRAEHYCNGAGAAINDLLDLRRGLDRDEMINRLLLFDAAIHARSVSCPVMIKLAERDDVVPAPSAAAVGNGLATPVDQQLRFVTRYGHFDGGLADLRRHAAFERIHAMFADPRVNPVDLRDELGHAQPAVRQ